MNPNSLPRTVRFDEGHAIVERNGGVLPCLRQVTRAPELDPTRLSQEVGTQDCRRDLVEDVRRVVRCGFAAQTCSWLAVASRRALGE